MSRPQPRIARFDPARFRWRGAPEKPYKSRGEGALAWDGVRRFVLLGADAPTAFELRYFEIAPGGFSSFERHAHAHAVVVVRGRGTLRLGGRVRRLRPMDFVYIPPGVAHQFRAGREPFGFLCPVDAVRDRPQPALVRRRRGGYNANKEPGNRHIGTGGP